MIILYERLLDPVNLFLGEWINDYDHPKRYKLFDIKLRTSYLDCNSFILCNNWNKLFKKNYLPLMAVYKHQKFQSPNVKTYFHQTI